MTHEEFVTAYREGGVRAVVDRRAAARYVSARMMLPLLLLPVLGIAVALALTGFLVWAATVFVLAVVFRAMVRASSRGFVLTHALESARFYEEALAAGILRPEPIGEAPRP